MGKATIASGGTEGLYTVNLDYGSEIITAQVAAIDAQIADRQADLTEAETAASDAQTALDMATAAVDTAINVYAADPTDENRQAMNAAATEATRLAAEYRNAEARRQSLAAIVLSLQADKSQLQSVRTSETRSAWCVDYTEDATGEVATIEVPGEVGTLVIAPGGRAPTAADGRLIARGAQVSYQCYYNAAILPGWQRFVHPYRAGTLTAIDYDAHAGTVDLDAATSSANELQVRDPETITCPIEYMTCNSAAFEEGDRVIVDTTGPKVIGFESNPRTCLPPYCVLKVQTYNAQSPSPVWVRDGGSSTPQIIPDAVNEIIRTQFFTGRSNVNISMPAGFPGWTSSPITRLHIYHWTTSIRWSSAIGYRDVVGTDSVPPPPEPAGFSEIKVIDPAVTDFNLAQYRQFDGQPYESVIGEITMTGLQLPSVHGSGYTDDYAEVWGYDTLYRYTVSGIARWNCGGIGFVPETFKEPNPCGDAGSSRYFFGDFTLELERENVGDLLTEMDGLSGNQIPATFTVNGVTYHRKRSDWLGAERAIGIVYAREDVQADPITYAPGFWA